MDYPTLLRDVHWTPRQDGPGLYIYIYPSLQRPLKERLSWWCSVKILSKYNGSLVQTIKTMVV